MRQYSPGDVHDAEDVYVKLLLDLFLWGRLKGAKEIDPALFSKARLRSIQQQSRRSYFIDMVAVRAAGMAMSTCSTDARSSSAMLQA